MDPQTLLFIPVFVFVGSVGLIQTIAGFMVMYALSEHYKALRTNQEN